jgi:hypothetical protein
MLKIIGRGLRSPALWALGLIVSAPALVNAQQSGLFPFATIRRERVPCPAEDPVYRTYRQVYFGYHPTCWRQFPAGWGCPSPEAPNTAEALKTNPIDVKSLLGAGPAPDGAGALPPGTDEEMMPPPGNVPAVKPTTPKPSSLPPVPSEERSPFDLDTKPKPNAPASVPTPLPTPAPGAAAGSKPAAADPGPELPALPSVSASVDGPNLPSLPAADDPILPPIEEPGSPASATTTTPAAIAGPRSTSVPASTSTGGSLPLVVESPAEDRNAPPALALPEPSTPSAPTAGPVYYTPQAGPNAPSAFTPADDIPVPTAPVQAPQRTSIIGRIFNRLRR